MADTKISALTAASALGGTEEIPGVQSLANVKVTATQIKTFTSNAPTLVTPEIGAATGTSLTLTGTVQAGSSGAVQLSTDVKLNRDAANTLALRNSTAAQAFNVYNTYTDASNYERFETLWSSNVLYLYNKAAGTGTNRQMTIGSPVSTAYDNKIVIDPAAGSSGGTKTLELSICGTKYIEVNNVGGSYRVGSTAGRPLLLQSTTAGVAVSSNFMEFDEMTAPSAPAANKGRLYFADNGGKTAAYIIFPSGAAQQIAIEP